MEIRWIPSHLSLDNHFLNGFVNDINETEEMCFRTKGLV